MSKKAISIFLIATLLLAPMTSHARKSSSIVSFANECQLNGYGIGFFNGVGNTEGDAIRGLAEVTKAVMASNEVSPDADIRPTVFYNETSKTLGIRNPAGDIMEVFVQRAEAAEPDLEKRLEIFWLAMSEKTKGGFLDQLEKRLGNGAMATFDLIDGIYEDVMVESIGALASAFEAVLNSSDTHQMYANHQAKVQSWALEGRRMLMVAHSQGNLFVNQAYEAAVGLTGYSGDSIGVVHIAPASQDRNGPYTLADLDVVIQGLRLEGFGSVPPSNVKIPLDVSMGHSLIDVYLNKELPTYEHVANNLKNEWSRLQKPSLASDRGIFTATLVWDKNGDIDLHSFEPNGTQVYYQNPTGQSGELDYDDTITRGPEHYNAECSEESLQRGTYQFAVNNYSGQTGTKATVMVTTSDNKNVLTKSVIVGEPRGSTGNSSPIIVGSIEVSNIDGVIDGEQFIQIKAN